MADAEVDVPGIGGLKRSWVIGGVSAAAGYILYRYWKARSSPPAAAVPVPGDATAAAPAAGSDAYSNPGAGAGMASFQAGTASGTAPTTDQAWTAAVVQDLENLGYNPQAVAEALAQYLGSQPLSTSQISIVRLAWAYEGRPPGHPSLPILQGGTDTPAPPVTTPAPPPSSPFTGVRPIGPALPAGGLADTLVVTNGVPPRRYRGNPIMQA